MQGLELIAISTFADVSVTKKPVFKTGLFVNADWWAV